MEKKVTGIDVSALSAELLDINEVSSRALLAHHAIAMPLAGMRASQQAREAARAAALLGTDAPETQARASAAAAGAMQLALLRAETGRLRVTPLTPSGDGKAAISGRVVRGEAPVVDATVVAAVDGKRTGHVCTDAGGGFALEIPADADVIVSVQEKAPGGKAMTVFVDAKPRRYAPGQQGFREIDLDGLSAPCEPPDADAPLAGVLVPDVTGETLQNAGARLKKAGLVRGDVEPVVTGDSGDIGIVVRQLPAGGVRVDAGSTVKLFVGAAPTDDGVAVPKLVGLSAEEARKALSESDLALGAIKSVASTQPPGRIVEQSPSAKTKVARQSRVDISVSTPQETPVKPPTRAVARPAGRIAASAKRKG